jgi:hypothetical protein
MHFFGLDKPEAKHSRFSSVQKMTVEAVLLWQC